MNILINTSSLATQNEFASDLVTRARLETTATQVKSDIKNKIIRSQILQKGLHLY